MPCDVDYYYGFWQRNPGLWERCRQQAAEEMISAGWDKHAGKFDAVKRKKAMKLWNAANENKGE